MPSPTYEQARDSWLASIIRKPSTLENYRRGIDLFIEYAPAPLHTLDARRHNILIGFVQWLRAADPPPAYAKRTAALYLTAVRQWFAWLKVNGHLPSAFVFEIALYNLRQGLKAGALRTEQVAPEPPAGMEQLIKYYESADYIKSIYERAKGREEIAARLLLEMARNRALLHCLAETGGRISEVLSLQVDDFPPQAFSGAVWRVRVRGKGDREYHLRFYRALSHIAGYIKARGAGAVGALFVAHSKRYDGQALSRQAAWKIVREAADTLGLEAISPHDFRHYRATQLVNAGEPLDVVQDYLGHRSVETTRRYYAHTRETRVDEATERVGLG